MTTLPQTFTYLKNHSNFTSIDEMDEHVKLHVQTHCNELKKSTREVLFNIAKHALKFAGAAHLKAETIANEIGMSAKSVYRSVKELVEFGIIAKENKQKMNGIKGANIYSILPCVSSNVPSEMSHRENDEKPCESKDESTKNETESLILLNTSLSLKDTNITKKHADKELVDKMLIQKNALIAKLPEALHGLTLYFDDAQSIYDMTGVIFNAKNKIDKSVRIEEHEALFRKTITSVYEYWQRQVRKGNVDYNVFGLMSKAIKELTDKIVSGTAYDVPAKVEQAHTRKFEQAPDWMNVNKAAFNSRELVPDWMQKRNKVVASSENKVEIDFEAERRKILEKLNN